MTSRRTVLRATAATLALAASRAGFAQSQGYPNKRVRILVGFAPGGIVDTLARLLADRLTRTMGQPFVVENRPGAGGNLATGLVARAKGDEDAHALVRVSLRLREPGARGRQQEGRSGYP